MTLFFLVFFLLVSKHLSLHKDDSFGAVSTADQWRQPIISNAQYPNLISKNTWEIEFNAIEHVIKGLDFDSNHQINISFDTSEKLKLVTFELSSELTGIQWQRIEFLIKQSLGDRNGDTFYSLVNGYYYYQREYGEYLNEINRSNPIKKLALLKESKIKRLGMQSHHFGKDIATKLFSRKNETTDYFNSRRVINMENGLSNTEKKKRLLVLANKYKKAISQW